MRFGRKRGTPPPPGDVYDGLRQQILRLTPDQLGESAYAPILALLMETGYSEAVATLVGVVDGTTSLYFSNGGGVIGAGAPQGLRCAVAAEPMIAISPKESPGPSVPSAPSVDVTTACRRQARRTSSRPLLRPRARLHRRSSG